MKIVFLDRSTLGSDISLDGFKEFGEVITYDSTKPEETLKRVKNADIVITNKVVINSETMDNSNIKLICVAATGTNNVDLKHASLKKIEVKNVADYSTSSVSQLTFSIVLKFMQKLEYYENYTKDGKWENSDIFTNLDVPFHELADKTWGIIGLGGIGQNVAKIAESFGCRVNYYSTSGKNFNTDYIQVGFDELLSTSDIISIHCPLNDDTLNLISEDELLIMKEKTILLNLGRGGIINEDDLAKVIDEKELYCGIDVVSKEPIESNSPLRSIKNTQRLILTPHIGWASVEARNRLIEGVISNIKEHVL